MQQPFRDPLKVAIEAVRVSAQVCRGVQAQLITADTLEKKDRSPVTVADFASQAIVCAHLQHAFPDDVIVGEEKADPLRGPDRATIRAAVVKHVRSGLGEESVREVQVLDWIDRAGSGQATGARYWTVDPIDGTKGFLRGGQYAVALALLEGHRVVLGVLGCPNLQHAAGRGGLLVAARNAGTILVPLDGESCDGSSVHVDATTDAHEARFCESVEAGHSSHDDAARIAARLGIVTEPLRIDSQAKYAAVARGDAHIYLRMPTRADYRERIWDHAAGCVVVEQAGGRVTDIDGQPLDFRFGRRLEHNRGVVATNGLLHDQVLEAIRDTLGRE